MRAGNRDTAPARALADSGAVDTPAVVREAGTVWLQTTTVGVEGAARTIALGLVLVDSPVPVPGSRPRSAPW